MSDARYPMGAPLREAPLPGPDGTLDSDLLQQQAEIRRRRSPFEPPPELGMTPRIVPRNLLRAAQADDIRTSANALAARHDAEDIGLNAIIDGTRERASRVSSVRDIEVVQPRREVDEANSMFLGAVTSNNLPLEMMQLTARLRRTPQVEAAATMLSSTGRALANTPAGVVMGMMAGDAGRLLNFSNSGNEFLKALAVNSTAGTRVLGPDANTSLGLSIAGLDLPRGGITPNAAREEASREYDELYATFPRPMQLVIDELSPVNIALTFGTGGASTALRGAGFKGSGLLASFIEPSSFVRATTGAVGARLAWENSDQYPLGVRLPLAAGAAVLASSPDSLLRAVNNLDDLSALARVAEPTESSVPGVTAIPKFGLREQWPRFWIPVEGGAIMPPTVTNPATALPNRATQQLFDTQPIQAGLSWSEGVANQIRRGTRLQNHWFEDDMYAAPAMAERARVGKRIDSQATATAHSVAATISRSFEFDDTGRIATLGQAATGMDAPTMSTLAAKYPLYEPFLSDTQKAAVDSIRKALGPMGSVYESLGFKQNVAGDIMDGGFYFPRGSAYPKDYVPQPRIHGRAGASGAKSTSEHMRQFATHDEAIAAGYVYEPPRTAVHNYVQQVGDEALNAHIAGYFKALRDPVTGAPVLTNAGMAMLNNPIRKQVETVRAKLSGRLKTLQRRSAVETVAERAAGQAERRGDAALTRAANAELRATAIGPVDPAEMADARAAVGQAVTEARALATDIADNLYRTAQAGGALSDTERALQSELNDLHTATNLADTMFSGQSSSGLTDTPDLVRASNGAQAMREQWRLVDDIQGRIDKLTARAEAQAEKVDDLIMRGDVRADMDAAAREDFVLSRQRERFAYHHDRQFGIAKRELTVLERELARRGNEAAQAGESAAAAAARTQATRAEIEGFRTELGGLSDAYMRAKSAAASPPLDTAPVALPGLQGYNVPVHIANAITKVLQNEGIPSGRGSGALRVWQAYSNLWTGARATLDNSVLGVQGLLGMADNARVARAAWRTNLHAWNSEQALGEHIVLFDQQAAELGTLPASGWASQGLNFASGAGEFQLGETGLGNLENLTVLGRQPIRAANRAFGYTGTTIRLDWAADELEREIRNTGKTVQAMIDDGTVGRIATSVNRLTGIADTQFGGTVGDFALFAPRFLQARIETVMRGAAGAAQGVGHLATGGAIGAPGVENRMAARSLGKLITFGTALTFLANEALGNETDTDLIKDGHRNPNFMTVRVGDNDFSLFGTYGALLGMVATVGAGAANRDIYEAAGAYRGLASGPIAMGWNLLTGEDFRGRPTGTPMNGHPLDFFKLVGTMAQTVVPFSAPGLAGAATQAGQAAMRGDVLGVASETLAGAFGFIGGRTADITLGERVHRARDESVKKATFIDPASDTEVRAGTLNELADTLGTRLAEFQADLVDADGKIAPLKAQQREELEQRKAQGDQRAEAILNGVVTNERLNALALEKTVNGQVDGKEYREGRVLILAEQRGASQAYADGFRSMASSSNPIDRAVSEWYGLLEQAQNPGTKLVDFEVFNALEDEFANRVGEDMFARVQANISLAPQGAGQAETELRKVRRQLDVAGFFELRQKAWQETLGSPEFKDVIKATQVTPDPSIKDPEVRAKVAAAEQAYVDALVASKTPEQARIAGKAFRQLWLVEVKGWQPGPAVQEAENWARSNGIMAKFDTIMNGNDRVPGRIAEWAAQHTDLVEGARTWGYIGPKATGVSPLRAAPVPTSTPAPRTANVSPDRQMVALHDSGLSYGQIGNKFDMTGEAVRSRIRRALAAEEPQPMLASFTRDADGSLVVRRADLRVVRGPDGRPAGIGIGKTA